MILVNEGNEIVVKSELLLTKKLLKVEREGSVIDCRSELLLTEKAFEFV